MIWKPTVTSDEIIHSAKGSHWKNHKYTKIINGVYIYSKAAAKAKIKAKKYAKEHEKYVNQMGSESAWKGIQERDASDNSDWGRLNRRELGQNNSNKSLDYMSKKAGRAWANQKEAEKSARSYEKLAKQSLASIPKEVISDGKRICDSLLKKIDSAIRPVKSIGVDSDVHDKKR